MRTPDANEAESKHAPFWPHTVLVGLCGWCTSPVVHVHVGIGICVRVLAVRCSESLRLSLGGLHTRWGCLLFLIVDNDDKLSCTRFLAVAHVPIASPHRRAPEGDCIALRSSPQ